MIRKSLSVVLLFAFVVSCAPKTLPPESVPAYRANEILIRVQELQKTTIELYDSKGITKERADIIVGFCVTTAEVLRDSRIGWQETVKASWAQLNQRIPIPDGNLKVIWGVVGGLIGGL